MSVFRVLLLREFKESIRNYRLLVTAAVFLALGLGTPLLFYFLPSLLPDDQPIPLPEFTAANVAAEYVSTIGQLGLLLAVLLAMGSVARERDSGTAAITLSKPVGRGVFVSAKALALCLIFAIGLIIGSAGAYLYIAILFEGLNAASFAGGIFLLGLYLFVCLSVTIMYSAIFRSQLAAGGVALVTLIFLTAISALPAIGDYTPGALLDWAGRLATDTGPSSWGSLAVGLILAPATVLIGWQIFRTKEL